MSTATTWLQGYEELICPDCGASLASVDPMSRKKDQQGTLRCSSCKTDFPISGRVLRCVRVRDAKEIDKTGSSYGFAWKGFWKGLFDPQDVFGLGLRDTGDYFLRSTGLKTTDLKELKVLDAGTGSGRLPLAIAGWGCEIYALDIHEGIAVIAERFGESPNVRFVQANIVKAPFKEKYFDIVWSSGVLMITADPRASFAAISKLVKQGGRLFVSVYSKDFHHYRLVRRILPFAHRFPPFVNYALAGLLGIPLYAVFNAILWTVRMTQRAGAPYKVLGYTFENADNKSYRSILLNVFDQLVPTFQKEYTESEIVDWFKESGFREIVVTEKIGMVAVRGVRA